jgi:hypothetical protein
MDTEYRIESIGSEFKVLDPLGEYLVQTFPTEEAAQHAIEECKKEDELWETAKLLVEISKTTLMKMHNVDHETADRLIKDATGG